MRIAGIVNDSIVDGPGLRLTVFLQGCQLDCPGCHNPQTHDQNKGDLQTVSSVFSLVKANPLLSGVTLSGGEPLLQAKALIPLAKQVKDAGLNLYVYTGYTFEQLLSESNSDVITLLGYVDVLIDGPFVLAQKSLSLPFRGSRNQRILDVMSSLKERKAIPVSDEAWGYHPD